MAEEHRIAQRRRVLKAGSITFAGGAAITCTVRNFSSTGAALEVVSPVGIPDQFKLIVEMEHSVRLCEVVWRKEKRIGVRFIDRLS
jgi:hypothetical protein